MFTFAARETNASFGKFSMKHSKSFQIFLSNHKLARALTNTPKAVAPTNTSCCSATSETNTVCSVLSWQRDFAISWCLFPLTKWFGIEAGGSSTLHSSCLSNLLFLHFQDITRSTSYSVHNKKVSNDIEWILSCHWWHAKYNQIMSLTKFYHLVWIFQCLSHVALLKCTKKVSL